MWRKQQFWEKLLIHDKKQKTQTSYAKIHENFFSLLQFDTTERLGVSVCAAAWSVFENNLNIEISNDHVSRHKRQAVNILFEAQWRSDKHRYFIITPKSTNGQCSIKGSYLTSCAAVMKITADISTYHLGGFSDSPPWLMVQQS